MARRSSEAAEAAIMQLIENVRRFGAQHQLWAPEVRVVAAVSGGSDSVAMLLILHELASRGEVGLAGLAHLNHQIRGPEADGDAAFCRDLAARLGIPAFMSTADVPALAAAEKASLEVAGRHQRQRFFSEIVQSGKANRIAIAHTRDDQAETVLLRLTRGAGALGLSGMVPRRGPLVRPVLDATRIELQEFLGARGEAWREDATNLDLSNPRNFVRHQVLPQLRRINPQADAALARAADLLRIDADLLETLANAAFVQNVESASAREFPELRRDKVDAESMVVVIRAEGLAKLPAALATRVARYALETANPSRSYGLEEAQALCAFAAGGTADALSGLDMERLGAKVVLSKREPGEVPTVVSFELRLSVPGTVEPPHKAWAITAEGPMAVPAEIAELNRGGRSVVVDASELGDHLIVRARRSGDRLQPLGAPGRKKVQDVLVDRKVPRDDRDRVAIVTTQKGQIVWVAGEALAEPFRVTPLTKSVVVLTLRRK